MNTATSSLDLNQILTLVLSLIVFICSIKNLSYNAIKIKQIEKTDEKFKCIFLPLYRLFVTDINYNIKDTGNSKNNMAEETYNKKKYFKEINISIKKNLIKNKIFVPYELQFLYDKVNSSLSNNEDFIKYFDKLVSYVEIQYMEISNELGYKSFTRLTLLYKKIVSLGILHVAIIYVTKTTLITSISIVIIFFIESVNIILKGDISKAHTNLIIMVVSSIIYIGISFFEADILKWFFIHQLKNK